MPSASEVPALIKTAKHRKTSEADRLRAYVRLAALASEPGLRRQVVEAGGLELVVYQLLNKETKNELVAALLSTLTIYASDDSFRDELLQQQDLVQHVIQRLAGDRKRVKTYDQEEYERTYEGTTKTINLDSDDENDGPPREARVTMKAGAGAASPDPGAMPDLSSEQRRLQIMEQGLDHPGYTAEELPVKLQYVAVLRQLMGSPRAREALYWLHGPDIVLIVCARAGPNIALKTSALAALVEMTESPSVATLMCRNRLLLHRIFVAFEDMQSVEATRVLCIALINISSRSENHTGMIRGGFIDSVKAKIKSNNGVDDAVLRLVCQTLLNLATYHPAGARLASPATLPVLWSVLESSSDPLVKTLMLRLISQLSARHEDVTKAYLGTRFMPLLLAYLTPQNDEVVQTEVLTILAAVRLSPESIDPILQYCLVKLQMKPTPEMTHQVFAIMFRCTKVEPDALVETVIPALVPLLADFNHPSHVLNEAARIISLCTGPTSASHEASCNAFVRGHGLEMLRLQLQYYDPTVQRQNVTPRDVEEAAGKWWQRNKKKKKKEETVTAPSESVPPLNLANIGVHGALMDVLQALMASSEVSTRDAVESSDLLPGLLATATVMREFLETNVDLPRYTEAVHNLEMQLFNVMRKFTDVFPDYVFHVLSDGTVATRLVTVMLRVLEQSPQVDELVDASHVLLFLTADMSTHRTVVAVDAPDGRTGWLFAATSAAMSALFGSDVAHGGGTGRWQKAAAGDAGAAAGSELDVYGYRKAMLVAKNLCHVLYDVLLDTPLTGRFFSDAAQTTVPAFLAIITRKLARMHEFEYHDTPYVMSLVAILSVLAALPRYALLVAFAPNLEGAPNEVLGTLSKIVLRVDTPVDLLLAACTLLWHISRVPECVAPLLAHSAVVNAVVARVKTEPQTDVLLLIMSFYYNLADQMDSSSDHEDLTRLRVLVPWMLGRMRADRAVGGEDGDSVAARVLHDSVLELLHSLTPFHTRNIAENRRDVLEQRRRYPAGMISDHTYRALRNPAAAATYDPADNVVALVDQGYTALQERDEPDWVPRYDDTKV